MTAFTSFTRLLAATALASAVVFNAAAAELPAGLTAPAKPARIPDFNLAKPDGGSVRANEFKGKVLIARFWATW